MYRQRPFAMCDLFNMPFHLIRVIEFLGLTLPISIKTHDQVICSKEYTVIVICLLSL